MQELRHALIAQTLGAPREVISLHFGPQGQGKKVYLQAGLHADEHPGMLVLHHLKNHLLALESAGRLTGEVVLVPIANPIGLGNYVFGRELGRFELSSRENFNRHYLDLAELVGEQVSSELGSDPIANVALIRRCTRERLEALQPRTELESLRLTLLRLASAADYVIDVHCDSEAMVHIYAHSKQQEQARVLASFTVHMPSCMPPSRVVPTPKPIVSTSPSRPYGTGCNSASQICQFRWQPSPPR